MHNTKLSWVVFALIVVFASCKRDFKLQEEETTTPTENIAAKDLIVPAGFNFETVKELNVKVKVANIISGQRYVIKIYNDLPTTGSLIATGLTDAVGEYAALVNVPTWFEYIYIEKIATDGSSSYEKVAAKQFATALFTNGNDTKPYILRKASSGKTCTSQCSTTHTNPGSNGVISVYDNQTVCITGNNIGTITVNVYTGGTVNISGNISGSINLNVYSQGYAKICASGTFSNITVNDGRLDILENTSLIVNAFNIQSSIEFNNYSDDLKFPNGFTAESSAINNYGTMTVTGDMPLLNVTYKNYGILNTVGSPFYGIYVNGTSLLENYNTLNVTQIYVDIPATFKNYCKSTTVFLTVQGTFENSGYIHITDLFVQNFGTSPITKLKDGAMIKVNHLLLAKGKILGTGSTRSKIKVTDITEISSPAIVDGAVDICDANGLETNTGSYINTATTNCVGYLSKTTCNPEGFGTIPSVEDTDSDGVADAQDEFPNDGTKAFRSYYPSISGQASLAFEDLWPSLGDFDYNDLVLLYTIEQTLNANNMVVEYKVKMKVKALGASFVNGFGFQFDELAPADISTVTGQLLTQNLITLNANNTEANQNKAVIICYDSPEPSLQRAGGSMFNTIKTNGTGTSDTITVTVTFVNPVSPAKLAFDKFNPFIFTNKRRGYEIHLGNFKPTTLANTSIFSTYEDKSDPSKGIYYKTANGMPWAISIPVEFNHTIEKAAITDGYNLFSPWVREGGTFHGNWYTNAFGNRNAANIY